MLGQRLTLQMRLIAGIAAALIATLTMASAVVYWHATSKIEIEMRSALAVGERVARNELSQAPLDSGQPRALRRLIAHFHGNRHVRASLLDRSESMVARSELLAPENAAPDWFVRFVGAKVSAVRLPLRSNSENLSALLIEADPTNEVAEAWSDIVTYAQIFLGFCALALLLLSWMLARAIRPIQTLLAGYEAIGEGDYAARVVPDGSPELQRLCHGFNEMAQHLGDMAEGNRRLSDQLERVQDEERAELARDLHDELSPLLFAAGVDTEMIADFGRDSNKPAIVRQANQVQDHLALMKRIVTAVLGRLRPALLLDQGLETALSHIADSWRRRHPGVHFAVEIAIIDDPSEAQVSGLFFVAREAVSNALRHGRPSKIAVHIQGRPSGGIELTVSDNGGGLRAAKGTGRFGIIGMTERIEALGGQLSVAATDDGSGVEVKAFVPGGNGKAALQRVQRMEAAPS